MRAAGHGAEGRRFVALPSGEIIACDALSRCIDIRAFTVFGTCLRTLPASAVTGAYTVVIRLAALQEVGVAVASLSSTRTCAEESKEQHPYPNGAGDSSREAEPHERSTLAVLSTELPRVKNPALVAAARSADPIGVRAILKYRADRPAFRDRIVRFAVTGIAASALSLSGCGESAEPADTDSPIDASVAVDARLANDALVLVDSADSAAADGETRCDSGLTFCVEQCVDLQSQPEHCGGCNQACPSPGANQTIRCAAGECVYECVSGYGDCDGAEDNGCEVSLSESADHCGECGDACVAGDQQSSQCVAGRCETSCNPGFDDCDGEAANGCEQSLEHFLHCGECRRECPHPPGAMAECVAGECGGFCITPYADCDGSAENWCETDTRFDRLHCGGCDIVCPEGWTCGQSTCAPPKQVFLSSMKLVPSTLGSLEAADAFCQMLATNATLSGLYKAWLSDSAQGPAQRFERALGRYVRTDGMVVTEQGWMGLVNNQMQVSINVDEHGSVITERFRTLTNTTPRGEPDSGGADGTFCDNYTGSAGRGLTGDEQSTFLQWSDAGWTPAPCDQEWRVYCFEQ